MPSWPGTLPDLVLQDGYKKQPLNNAVTIDVESGEPMTRLRFSGDVSQVSASIMVDASSSQLSDFWVFWKTTLSRGSVRFSWSDPSTGDAADFIFSDTPVETCVDGMIFRIDMSLIMFG